MQIVVVYMVVYLELLLLELLSKFLQHRLHALLQVFVLVDGLGLAPVHLDPLLGLLDLQSKCSQGCWDLSHQVSLGSLHLLQYLI